MASEKGTCPSRTIMNLSNPGWLRIWLSVVALTTVHISLASAAVWKSPITSTWRNPIQTHSLIRHRRATHTQTVSVVESTSPEFSVNTEGFTSADNRFHIEGDEAFMESLPFELNEESGLVRLKAGRVLDYDRGEEGRIYQFDVLVNRTNTSTTNEVSLTVNVTPKNDERPMFTMEPSPFHTTIAQGRSIRARTLVYTLTAQDRDHDSSLRFAMSDPAGLFAVNAVTGAVTTTTEFVYSATNYGVTIRVWDENGEGELASSSAILTIVAGLLAPQFYQPFYSTTIAEHVSVNSVVHHTEGRLHARPNSVIFSAIRVRSYQNQRLSFSIEESDLRGVFALQELPRDSSGSEAVRVVLLTTLDYERGQTQLNVTIKAQEDGTLLSSTVKALVTVLDLNDYQPTFLLSEVFPAEPFAENVPNGTEILTVTAVDGDSGENGRLAYSVRAENGKPVPFTVETVNNRGIIKTSGPLDYEFDGVRTGGYHLRVTATDHGSPSRSGSVTVRVRVTNMNDERPRFEPPSMEVEVERTHPSGMVIAPLSAFDPDGSSIRMYAFADRDGGPFIIDPSTGSVTLDGSLSNGKSKYVLNVSAEDSGSCCVGSTRNTGYTLLTVLVVGVNQAPRFDCAGYSNVQVDEESNRGTLVQKFTAEDTDVGRNGQLKYYLERTGTGSLISSNYFYMEEDTGNLYVLRGIDREETSEIYLTIKATDGGIYPLSTYCTFLTRLTDINDNAPDFVRPSGPVVVKSGTPVNTTLYTFFASDRDLEQNGEISFSMVKNDGNLFWVDGRNLRNAIGLNVVGSHDLKVRATDGGVTPLHTDVDVTVTVQEQDNAPNFVEDDNNFRYTILENVPENTIVARIKAVAPGGTGDVTYFVAESSSGGAFYADTIDQGCKRNNQLCLAVYQTASLDYEQVGQRRHEVRVRATINLPSGQTASREQLVVIELEDVNDNVPRFQFRDSNGFVRGTVRENVDVANTLVLTLVAKDADTKPSYRTKEYQLVEGSRDSDFFVVGSDGSVRVRSQPPQQQFDRETKSLYIIEVMAIDGAESVRSGVIGPNKEQVPVHIEVIDDNDNPPRFLESLYEGSVSETAGVGEVVIQTSVEDVDINNRFSYRISLSNGASPDAFRVDDTGRVIVASLLDYDLGTNVYDMTMTVSDGRHEGTTQVIISLTNENDNVPQFTNQYYSPEGSLLEEMEYRSEFLVRVSATDADKRAETRITYSLDGANAGLFFVNSVTGDVYLTGKLDRDRPNGRPQWDVNVLATDEPGSPEAKVGYAVVRVEPVDINDNAPKFVNPPRGWIREGSPAGSKVMTLLAVDYDADSNAEVEYSLVGGTVRGFPTRGGPATVVSDSLFSIEADGTVLLQQASLDREVVSRYEMLIKAKDKGAPSLEGDPTVVTIYVTDINDNVPRFTMDCWSAQMSEVSKVTDVIFSGVTASDPDINDTLAYSLTDDQSRRQFSIRASPNKYRTAEILLHTELDYESPGQPTEFFVNMSVTDGDASHTDTACVRVTLLDANDERPSFQPNTRVSVTVSELAPPGTFLADFNATDADVAELDSTLRYYIDQSTDPDRSFTIDTVSGVVSLRRTLDREPPGKRLHQVSVLAVDQGYPPLSSVAQLVVTVSDVNDNAPVFETPVVYITEGAPAGTFVDPLLIKAVDHDDDTNGPPFLMELAESSALFNFTFIQDEDNGRGAASMASLRPLDRETDGPEVTVPIRLTDAHGMSAVRGLTVVIRDEDDNPPVSATRMAHVFNYEGDFTVVPVGDCYADDPDDWDKPNKDFAPVGVWPAGFSILSDRNSTSNGLISVDLSALPSPDGVFELDCSVTDHYRGPGGTELVATVQSKVMVTVQQIGQEPVRNAASVRLEGLTAVQFLSPDPQREGTSRLDAFQAFLADQLRVPVANVDVFTVRDVQGSSHPAVDVRFAAHGSPYYNASKLLYGIVSNRNEFESLVDVTLGQAPVDPCAGPSETCAGGCTPHLVIADTPLLVNANGSSLLGVDSYVEARCGCSADLRASETLACGPGSCLNGGVCSLASSDGATEGYTCECPPGFDGPRCQQRSHHFPGNGWAWYPTLSQCTSGNTSLELSTSQSDSLVLYNGPNTDPGSGPDAVTDFVAIAVVGGYPHLIIDQGSGVVQGTLPLKVDDGKWHKLDIRRIGRDILFTVDDCRSGVGQAGVTCEIRLTPPGSTRLVNVATPLELGGSASSYLPPSLTGLFGAGVQGFSGCVRNLVHNKELYDLHIGSVGQHKNTADGCPPANGACSRGSCSGANSLCDANILGEVTCSCRPMYWGPGCSLSTPAVDFLSGGGQLLWSLTDQSSMVSSSYTTDIQLSFRSRDADGNGLLFQLLNSEDGGYMRLQLREGQLEVAYDIGINNTADTMREQHVTLTGVVVTDGVWHTARVMRVGRRVVLTMDSGEGRFYAEWENRLSAEQLSITVSGVQMTSGDQNGDTLSETCITDIRYAGQLLPMSFGDNSPQLPARLTAKSVNLTDGCQSNACSAGAVCVSPLVCVDLWKKFACRCPPGFTVAPGGGCSNINECTAWDEPCFGRGTCTDEEGSFRCACVESWIGTRCTLKMGSVVTGNVDGQAIGITVGVIAFIALVGGILAFFIYRLRHASYDTTRSEGEYDPYKDGDLRENVVDYAEEGAPEEDQDGYDLGFLPPKLGSPNGRLPPAANGVPPYAGTAHDQPPYKLNHPDFLDSPGALGKADPNGPPPPDSFCDDPSPRVYHDEGVGSVTGTLSELVSASSDTDHDYSYLKHYGSKFGPLNELYRQDGEDDF